MSKPYDEVECVVHREQYRRDYSGMGAMYYDLPIPRLHATIEMWKAKATEAEARAKAAELEREESHRGWQSQCRSWQAKADEASAEIVELERKLDVARERDACAKREIERLTAYAAMVDPITADNAETAFAAWLKGGKDHVVADRVPAYLWMSGYASGESRAIKAETALAEARNAMRKDRNEQG